MYLNKDIELLTKEILVFREMLFLEVPAYPFLDESLMIARESLYKLYEELQKIIL